MSYAGDANLDPKIQQRILTAFAEAVRLYREGLTEEALTILRSIADVDANFAPAQRLDAAISAGAPVDLGQLLGEMTAASTVDVEGTIGKARHAFEQRDYQGALTLAQTVLRDLPGHADARRLAVESQGRLRGAGEVDAHLARAKETLDAGLVEEARSFLRLARNADPAHPLLATLEQRLVATSAPAPAEPEFEFEVYEQAETAGSEGQAAEAVAPMEGLSASSWDEVLPAAEQAPLERMVTQGGFAVPEGGFGLPAIPSFDAGQWEALPGAATAVPVAPPASFEVAPQPATPPRQTAPAAPPPPPPALRPVAQPGAFAVGPPTDEQGMEFAFDEPVGYGVAEGEAPAPALGPQFGGPPRSAAGGGDGRVQELLEQGQQCFDAGDYQGAIDIWSRLFLVDANHPEAGRRVEQAQRRREEVEREAEHRFYEARDAFEQGHIEEARVLCQEVLRLQPQHLDAHDLLLRLDMPEAPPPPAAPAMSQAEDDLFKDDYVPSQIAAPAAAVARAGAAEVGPYAPVEAQETRERKATKLPVPLPVLLGGVGAILLILGGIFFLGPRMFSSDSNALSGALRQADQLATEGRLQEAIQVLESMQNQVHGEQLNLLIDRLREYRGKLQRKPTPVPIVDFKVVRDAIAASQRLKAYRQIQEGLAKYPTDLELTRLQNEVTAYSSAYPALQKAIGSANWETVMRLTEQITAQHPEDPEARRLWAGAAYNFSVDLLGKYQVAQAHTLLGELLRKQDDVGAEKLQQFAKSYLSRPVDPRYRIFVDNVELRQVE